MGDDAATAERLRSKHIRTLELLQTVMDENKGLHKQVEDLQRAVNGGAGGGAAEGGGGALQSAVAELREELERTNEAREAEAAAARDQLARAKKQLQTQMDNALAAAETKLDSPVSYTHLTLPTICSV